MTPSIDLLYLILFALALFLFSLDISSVLVIDFLHDVSRCFSAIIHEGGTLSTSH